MNAGPNDAAPEGAETALIAAHALAEAGDDRAESAYRSALALNPGSAEAHGALGEWLEAAGRAAEAAEAFAAAADRDPSTLRWLRSLARLEADAGRTAEAIEAHRRILERRPDDAFSHCEIANFRRIEGESAEAVLHYREALFLDPSNAEAATGLAGALVDTGEPVAALEALQPLLRRDPDHVPALLAAARAWLELGEDAKAAPLVERCLALDPEDRGGARALASRGAAGALTPAFVRALFDTYADRFDRDLLGRLGYRAPEILREAVDRALGEAGAGGRRLDVLDLGCGTGLAGLAFRDLAARLHGSDLSPRMVARAAERGVYDRLDVAELTDALRAEAEGWDLVVAADVLVYVGDLFPAFAAAAGALRPGGMLAATSERIDGDAAARGGGGEGPGYALGPARRFAHAERHVRDAAAAAGLTPVLIERASPRRERGEPVPGWAIVLRKPG
jgi:predicted TPR repeat methyltransferase